MSFTPRRRASATSSATHRPGLQQVRAVAAVHGQPAGQDVRHADLEPGGEDDAVHRVLDTADDGALGHPFHATVVRGVDERDVRPVERLQVLVAEGRPFAGVAVPRLEQLGRGGIVDDVVHARPDRRHLLQIEVLLDLLPLTGVDVVVGVRADDLAEDVPARGPGVGDEILGRDVPGDDRLEVLPPPRVPPGLQRGRPLGIRRTVLPNVHGGRCALEHVEVLGVPGERGYDLDARGTGADDGDALVGESVQPAVRATSGVAVIPAARVERVPCEVLDAGDAGQLGVVEVPFDTTTYDARTSSSRSVRTIHSPSSHRSSRTPVRNSASS
ncbi:hypothetical protein FHS23_002632 [Prauserella isguenensis]|uniref:Uncharacterized protein n=1 Tax=Prauserella isguenensis TaxID=1470180 RepID=A0A839S2S8_9PSEU|nr:hypothetical protein [Prauserella isguenensis]MBB3051603.1 hypothetical protein [Prauserella isguenensis]